jgi:tRNA dimethylallyltransferase
MNIGTAKPDVNERAQLEHVMIDCIEPNEAWSVGEHVRQSQDHIREALAQGRRVVLVGGTGLYIKGLVHGLFEGPGRDEALRAKLEAVEASAPGSLHAQLVVCDPETAARLSPRDLRRIVRALEVFELTGVGITRLQKEQRTDNPWKFSLIGIMLDREELTRNIEQRVDRMLADGLLDEVAGLLAAGCQAGMTSMQGVGYREFIAFLEGRISLDQARSQCISNTKALAHRQLMLFRRLPSLVWFHARDYQGLLRHCIEGGMG